MSETVTVRLDAATVAQLRDRAAESGLPPATMAARLIGAGLNGPAPEPVGDGEVVASVVEAFGELDGPNNAVRRTVAVGLARQVESAGPASQAAGQRLINMLADAAVTDEARQAMRALSTPEYTYCRACRKVVQ